MMGIVRKEVQPLHNVRYKLEEDGRPRRDPTRPHHIPRPYDATSPSRAVHSRDGGRVQTGGAPCGRPSPLRIEPSPYLHGIALAGVRLSLYPSPLLLMKNAIPLANSMFVHYVRRIHAQHDRHVCIRQRYQNAGWLMLHYSFREGYTL